MLQKYLWNCVSLIFPPRDNRGQNNEESEGLLRPPTAIYTHGPGLKQFYLVYIKELKFKKTKQNKKKYFLVKIKA